jgi:hypothetical protein
LQSLGNTEWLLNRAASKPTIAQPIGILNSPTVTARELVLPAINGVRAIPSWVILTTSAGHDRDMWNSDLRSRAEQIHRRHSG